MKKLDARDLKEMNLLKHYRIIRKWASRNNNLKEADLEVLVWRNRNRTTQKYNIYKVSFKGKQLISKIYRIMLGKEEIPVSERRNTIIKGNSYMDKVLTKAIYNVNKDKY